MQELSTMRRNRVAIGHKLAEVVCVGVILLFCVHVIDVFMLGHGLEHSTGTYSITVRITRNRSVMYSSQQFVEQLPVQDGEQCRELESHTTNVLINPDTTTNWKDWTFKRKRVCEEFPMTQALKSKKSRSKFSLNCAEQRISYSETNSTDVFTVNFRDSCLGSFIQRCCTDDNPVPNVVHLVWFGKNELKFFNFLTLMSVLRFINPCVVLIHGPDLPHGPYWEYFLQISPNIVHVYRERPTHVFKNQLRFKEHSSDVMRIEALIEYGGIYLDFDEVVLRSLHPLRRFPYTQGREMSFTLGSQLVMSEKNATFLRLWYESYNTNYRKTWAYNALWVPNGLAKRRPELIHVEGYNFTRPSWKNYKQISQGNYDWSTNYGMHMYARWYKKPIDPTLIRSLNTTVGSVARHVLLGNKELCVK